jgi:hypothetical protein
MNSTASIRHIQFRKFTLQPAPLKRKCRYHQIQGRVFVGTVLNVFRELQRVNHYFLAFGSPVQGEPGFFRCTDSWGG